MTIYLQHLTKFCRGTFVFTQSVTHKIANIYNPRCKVINNILTKILKTKIKVSETELILSMLYILSFTSNFI